MALQTPEYLETKTYTALRDRYLLSHTGLNQGPVGMNDFLVVQHAAGANATVDINAGACWVAGTNISTQGLYHIQNDATVVSANFATADATNPRVDQVFLVANDSTDGGSGSDVPTITVVTGTATAGATIGIYGNRNGAAAAPANAVRLADVLIPATGIAPVITTANIFDRRPKTRGATNIATTEIRSAARTAVTNYDTMPTADVVTELVVPANAYIVVLHQGTWQESVLNQARAAIFLGQNQVKIAGINAGPVTQAAATGPGQASAGVDESLFTGGWGLFSTAGAPGAYTGDVTTGQIVGGTGKDTIGLELNGTQTELTNATIVNVTKPAVGGPLYIGGLAAGTYHVSVQYKSASGNVTAKNRHFAAWVFDPSRPNLT